jgi:stress response protein YsnF
MSDGDPPRREVPDALDHTGTAEVQVLALHKEDLVVSKRVRKTLVQATRKTRTWDTVVQEDLHHDQVVVERVAIGRVIDAVPPVRQEGDVTILSVVEEVLVVERRLVLKEEVHLRRVRTTERHVETVALRDQDVSVTRTDIEA